MLPLTIHDFDYLTETLIDIQRDFFSFIVEEIEGKKIEYTFAIMIRSQLGNNLFVYKNVVFFSPFHCACGAGVFVKCIDCNQSRLDFKTTNMD